MSTKCRHDRLTPGFHCTLRPRNQTTGRLAAIRTTGWELCALDFVAASDYPEWFRQTRPPSPVWLNWLADSRKVLPNMKLDSLTILLPCHSLEDLSLDRSSEEANQIYRHGQHSTTRLSSPSFAAPHHGGEQETRHRRPTGISSWFHPAARTRLSQAWLDAAGTGSLPW